MKKSIFISLIFAGSVLAQTIQSPIAPSRCIDWTKAGVEGGIPDRTTVYTTLNPGATVAQVNAALAVCPAGQVVYLSAGTYNLTSGIDFNGRDSITLRGAGPDKTFLVFTGSCTCRGMGADICGEPRTAPTMWKHRRTPQTGQRALQKALPKSP